MIAKQLDINLKKRKIFDTFQLQGKWTCSNDSSNIQIYEGQENGASIVLNLLNGNFIETFCFKKGSKIVITDSIVEFDEKDLW